MAAKKADFEKNQPLIEQHHKKVSRITEEYDEQIRYATSNPLQLVCMPLNSAWHIPVCRIHGHAMQPLTGSRAVQTCLQPQPNSMLQQQRSLLVV